MFSEKIYINRRNSLRQKGLKGIVLILGNQESPMNYPANTYPFRHNHFPCPLLLKVITTASFRITGLP